MRSQSKFLASMMCGLMLVTGAAHAACYGDQSKATSPLVFSPVPQLPAPVMFARWAPVLESVGVASGQCFDLVIKASIPEFEKFLLSGTPALVYANPYHAVMAYKARDYQPLVAGGALLTGILVTKRDGNIKDLADLKGQRVDFPAPNSFAASLLIRAHLQARHIPIRPNYVKTHSNVYRGVLIGDAAAGGGVNKTLEGEPADIRKNLRILYESPGYRSHPILASALVPNATSERIRQSFLDLTKSEEGRALLAGIQLNNPIPVSYRVDYRPLEHLDLERLVVHDE